MSRGGGRKRHERAGHNGKSSDRREVIGGGGISGEKSRDRREVIGCGRIRCSSPLRPDPVTCST